MNYTQNDAVKELMKTEFERLSRDMNYYNQQSTKHEDEVRIAVTFLGTVFAIVALLATGVL